jgi:hypothetical protein
MLFRSNISLESCVMLNTSADMRLCICRATFLDELQKHSHGSPSFKLRTRIANIEKDVRMPIYNTVIIDIAE